MGIRLAVCSVMLLILLHCRHGAGARNTPTAAATPAPTTPASQTDSGLTATGRIVLGALLTVVAVLALGLLAALCHFKRAAKVTNNNNNHSGHTATNTTTTTTANNTYYSPRPLGYPGHVAFDTNAPVYQPPQHAKFLPPVPHLGDLSGGYRGYRPEYPSPYGSTVPYGAPFTRLVMR